MYTKGDLKQILPFVGEGCRDYWNCQCGNAHGSIMDFRDDDLNRDTAIGDVLLPHSCEQWVIGGKESIEALIADLQAALDRINKLR